MDLRDIQSSISDWIRAPEGVAAALVEEDSISGNASSSGALARLEGLVRSDEALDATGRLEIYANAYFHRIHGVLKNDFPALQAALGATPFHDMLTSYLLVEPSQHPSLRYAGERLANFLACHDAAAGIRMRSPWAADLAALEWTRVDAFDGPDGSVLEREALASLSPAEFGGLFLCLGSWVLLRSFDHRVERIWRAATEAEPIQSSEAPESTIVLVWRKSEEVVHRRLESLEAAALTLLVPGIRFEELCDWVATRIGEEKAPVRAAGWLEQWLADGLLLSPDDGDGEA